MTFHLCIYLHLLHSAWHIIGAQQMSVEQNYWSFKSRKKEYQRKTQRQARERKMTVPRKTQMVGVRILKICEENNQAENILL